jgi:putative ABC transport system permease protein
MTLPLLVYRSLRQHALSTIVTAASLALAAGLLMTVWVVKTQSQRAFTDTSTAFDAVLGARGSKLQLVLNAIFHLEASPGNLEWSDYQQIKRHPAVKNAIPIAVGDNYYGWRVVGTVPELFTQVEYSPGKRYTCASGKVFNAEAHEAVVGSFVAQKLGLKLGDEFQPYHGLAFNPENHHEEKYTVVGILEPTNTPADRVLWIPLEGVQKMSGHDPKTAEEISAVLIQLRSPAAGMMLDQGYNRQGNRLTFAYPASAIIADLFSKISWFDRILGLVAYLVAAVAAASVLASIYASMSSRRRDIAILRALGARRRLIFGSVVVEAGCIGAIGALLGFAVYLGLVTGVAGLIRAQTGVVIAGFGWHPVLWACPLGIIVLSALGGIVPAIKAYRIPVAETLVPTS